MGGPAKIGYWGGKLFPRENDLISGIVAEKSLHAFVAISKSPSGEILKVFHIKASEKKKNNIKIRVSIQVMSIFFKKPIH